MGPYHPPSTGKFVLPTAAVWLFLALASAVVLSRAAAAIEPTFAPWLLFPLLVGLVLGICLTWLLRWCECGHRATAIVGTLLAAILLMGAQHLWHYQRHLDAMRAAKQEILRRGPQFAQIAGNLAPLPPTVFEFLEQEAARGRPLWPGFTARGLGVWTSWGLDGVLLAGAAVCVVAVAVRRPYCNLCRSWYRLVWEGPLDSRRTAAARAAGLLPEGAECGDGRMTTWSCRGGCQPARVDLSWREKSAASRPVTRRTGAWLAPGQVMELAQAEPAFAPPGPPP
jgi:hypothetical protein